MIGDIGILWLFNFQIVLSNREKIEKMLLLWFAVQNLVCLKTQTTLDRPIEIFLCCSFLLKIFVK